MKSVPLKTHLITILAIVIAQACSAQPATEVLHILEPVTATPTVPVIPPATEVSGTVVPSSVIEVSATPAETIDRSNIPVSLPEMPASRAGDFDSSKVSSSKPVIGGDRFTFGQLERPFNAETMDVYFPELDIVSVLVFEDDSWIYGKIQLVGRASDPTLLRRYALEFDLNRDGRGDWLVIASNPLSTTWTVQGVQVYQDANGDVGGSSPGHTDPPATSGDGFELLVFDPGSVKHSDTAMARTSPEDPNVVEIAIRRSVLGSPKSYMIGMWAGSSMLDPRLFDLNDHFTYEQAGAADSSYFYYPIKEVSEIDNTCRMAVGSQTGKEIGLCNPFVPVSTSNGGGGSPAGGGSTGGGICPPCPQGYSQNPYPDCTCYIIIP